MSGACYFCAGGRYGPGHVERFNRAMRRSVKAPCPVCKGSGLIPDVPSYTENKEAS